LLLRVLVELGRASVGSHIVISLLVLESWLNNGDELLEQSKHFGFLEHLNRVASMLSLVVLEVSSVTEFLMLSFSDFLDLIMAHVELLAVQVVVVELSLSLGGFLWVLEANKGIDDLVVLGEELDVLDFTESSEKFLKLFFGSVGREVLHEEVASLL